MTYIQTVSEDDATGYIARIYEASMKANGGIFETSRSISLWPELMRVEEQRYHAVMLAETALTRAEKEAIALAVSVQNDCGYCAAHHKAMFLSAGGAADQAEILESQSSADSLPERLRQIVAFGLLKHSDEAACVQMRENGFTDREILEIIIVAGFFHDYNLRVSRLGLELEDWFIAQQNNGKGN